MTAADRHYLAALAAAATAAAKTPGITVSATYACAREAWGIYWREVDRLRAASNTEGSGS